MTRSTDYQRAAGLRAHALAKIGQREKAAQLFEETLRISTLSETQYNYACFLAAEGREAEAREWAERILRKKATMPDYIRRGTAVVSKSARAAQTTTAKRMTKRSARGSHTNRLRLRASIGSTDAAP